MPKTATAVLACRRNTPWMKNKKECRIILLKSSTMHLPSCTCWKMKPMVWKPPVPVVVVIYVVAERKKVFCNRYPWRRSSTAADMPPIVWMLGWNVLMPLAMPNLRSVLIFVIGNTKQNYSPNITCKHWNTMEMPINPMQSILSWVTVCINPPPCKNCHRSIQSRSTIMNFALRKSPTRRPTTCAWNVPP